MLLVNTDYITGKKFEMIGMVRGTMIQSVHLGKDIMNSFRTLVGGELTSYTDMMNEARAIATKRMAEDAQAQSAAFSHFKCSQLCHFPHFLLIKDIDIPCVIIKRLVLKYL